MALGRGLESLIPPQEDNQNWGDRENLNTESSDDNAGFIRREQDGILDGVPDPGVGEPEPEYGDVNTSEVEYEDKVDGVIFQIEVDKIQPNPHQPRRTFNEESLRELAHSIREFGVLQPIVVSKVERETDWGWSVSYELVAGHRRLLASKMIGLQTIPSIIRRVPVDREKLELAVVENVQRDDLNPIELARAVAQLQDEFGLTQREIASRLGKSREVIANSVRLLSLPTEVQNAISDGRVSESQARLLLSVDDESVRNNLFKEILDKNLSVREVHSRVRRHKDGGSSIAGDSDPEVAALKEELEEFLGTKVDLRSKGMSGKITITYYSPEELGAIIQKLLRRSDNQSL